MLTAALILFILVVGNGLFAGAEIAVLTTRKTRLAELAEAGSGGARAVRRLRDQPERFLATVQIGITVISATSAAYGADHLAGGLAERLPWLGDSADEIALALVVALVSYLTLVVGELVPKSLALRYADRYAVLIGRPLLFLAQVMRPLVWFLTASSNVILRLFGDRTTFTEARLSREELRELVEQAGKSGEIDRPSSEIAARAIEFGEATVHEVMMPRHAIAALPRQASAEEMKRALLEEGHSRMPVYDGELDNIIGYVIAKDVFTLIFSQALVILDDILRPAQVVPESARAGRVLRAMQKQRSQMAIVVDEHGAVVGLVTIEDLVEDLVGEIFAEGESDKIVRQPDGSYLVDGDVSVRDVERALGIHFPEGNWSTIAGLVIERAGWIPVAGVRVKLDDGTEIEVVETTRERVTKLRVRPATRA